MNDIQSRDKKYFNILSNTDGRGQIKRKMLKRILSILKNDESRLDLSQNNK